jgi:hypothetical protein
MNMGDKRMYLTVQKGTTDEQLVTILERVLPAHLVNTMNISPVMARSAARQMAQDIVHEARRCNQAHLVPAVSNRILLKAPSQAECDAFKKAVEELIVIRYGDGKSYERPWVKKTSGKLWYFLSERVLGLSTDKEDTSANAAVGVRG